MPNQQLVDYIKQSFAQGYSREEIKDALLKEGWAEDEVEQAFSAPGGTVEREVPVSESPVSPESQAIAGIPDNSENITRLPKFSNLFKETFRIFFANWQTFLGIAALPYAVIFIFGIVIGFIGVNPLPIDLTTIQAGKMPKLSITGLSIFAAMSILSWGLILLSSLALIFAVKERGRVGIFEAYSQAREKILSFLLVSFLSVSAFFAASFFFIIPGIILGVYFSLALYVLVYEDMRGRQALFRSRQLIRGNWWAVAGKTILFGIVLGIVLMIFLFPMAAGLGVFAPSFSDLPNQLASVFMTPLATIFAVLLYESLRSFGDRQTYQEPTERFKLFTNIAVILGPLLMVIVAVGSFFVLKLAILPQPQQLPIKPGAGFEGSMSPQGNLGSQPYENLNYGFRITPPKDWTVDESGQFSDAIFFFGPKIYTDDRKPFQININVGSESTKLGLDEYAEANKSILFQAFSDYKSVEDRKITVRGREAYVVGGTFSAQGVNIRNRQMMIIEDGKAFIVTATNLESAWDQYDDLIDASLNTFETL